MQWPPVVVDIRLLQLDGREAEPDRPFNESFFFCALSAVAAALLLAIAGCATTGRSSAADSDPRLHRAQDDHQIHGEVGVLYGRSG